MAAPDLEVVIEGVRTALVSGNTKRINAAALDLLVALGTGDCVSENEYAALVAILKSPEAINSDQSHAVYAQAQYLWEELTRQQRSSLVALLERLYPRLADWVSQLVLTDVFGTCLGEQEGLDVLQRLQRSEQEIARALLANGFGQIARHSSSPEASRRALRQLLEMRQDQSPVVQREAEDALRTVTSFVRGVGDHSLRSELSREHLL
jgi:hypothetical protein